jgi:uncharacterized membrane protein YedE/YeeE
MTHARVRGLAVYFALGTVFGLVLIKSEVVSWFRIYEMFRFQSIHMYAIIGSAVVTAGVSLQLITRFRLRTLGGEEIVVSPKTMGRGIQYWMGGIIFGLGWGIIGACPGPLLALIGGGVSVLWVALLGALAGTWMYGAMRGKLPH